MEQSTNSKVQETKQTNIDGIHTVIGVTAPPPNRYGRSKNFGKVFRTFNTFIPTSFPSDTNSLFTTPSILTDASETYPVHGPTTTTKVGRSYSSITINGSNASTMHDYKVETVNGKTTKTEKLTPWVYSCNDTTCKGTCSNCLRLKRTLLKQDSNKDFKYISDTSRTTINNKSIQDYKQLYSRVIK